MEFAIFCESVESDGFKSLQNIFSKKSILFTVFSLSDSKMVQGFSVPQLSESVTHCIYIASTDCPPELRVYAACFAAGRNIHVTILPDCTKQDNSFLQFLDEQKISFDAAATVQKARKQLVERGIPVIADSFSNAVARADESIIDLFFAADFSVNTCDSAGVPLLCTAVRNRHCALTQQLIDRGADVNLIAKDRGYSALMDAVSERQNELVSSLLDHGADPNVYSTDGQTALILAVGNKDCILARQLLEKGADPDRTDKLGMSARSYAILFHKSDLIQLFSNV